MSIREQQNRTEENADTYGSHNAVEKVPKTDVQEQGDARMAAILKARYTMLSIIDLNTGQCERVQLQGSGRQMIQFGDYTLYIERALSEYICPDDKDTFRRVLSLEHLRSQASETEEYYEETCQYRINTGEIRWVEQHVIYSRQNERVMVNILGRDISREKSVKCAS